MSDSSKAAMHEKRRAKRASDTGRGIYSKIRSKFIKGPDGYGAVISKARENLIAKNGGKDPGPNVVAHHLAGGSSYGNTMEEDSNSAFVSKSDNTRESNWRRGGKDKKWIKKKIGVV